MRRGNAPDGPSQALSLLLQRLRLPPAGGFVGAGAGEAFAVGAEGRTRGRLGVVRSQYWRATGCRAFAGDEWFGNGESSHGKESPLTVAPVQPLGAAKLFLVIIRAAFLRGVTGIEPAQARFATVADLQQHREDAQAAFGALRLEDAIHAGGGLLAHIEKTHRHQPGTVEHTHHSALARPEGRIKAEEGFEIFRHVVREALLVALKHRPQPVIQGGGHDLRAQVRVSVQHPALAFREDAGRQINAQRCDGLLVALFARLVAVAKKHLPKVPPARRPQPVHEIWRHGIANE